MKVLIVDDDQLTAATWSMGLKSAGFEVITATNGTDGINQVKTQKPDMVLLDQIMPDMLGNAVLTALKADPTTSNIPVMLISNYNENQMMKEAIEKGAVDYILKYQIETKDLVEKVKTLLTDLQGSAPATAAPVDPNAQVAAPPVQGQPQQPSPTQPQPPVQPQQPNNPQPNPPADPTQNNNTG